MSVRTIKSITWLWIASLLIATVGVSGQQIYCYCKGKTTFSLFSANDACAEKQRNKALSCCAKTPAKPRQECCEKMGFDNSSTGCSNKTTKVFQLKTEFTVQENQSEKSSAPALDQPLSLNPYPVFGKVLGNDSLYFHLFSDPPPPIPGRMICVRHGVFRC